MGLVALCDAGCGATGEPAEFVTFGIVRQVHYCRVCAHHMKSLLEARDAAHTEAATNLSSSLLGLVKDFRDLHPKAKLPDDPTDLEAS